MPNTAAEIITDKAPIIIATTTSSGVQASGGLRSYAQFSPDGTKIVFVSEISTLVSGDTNASLDVFVKDLITGVTTRVSTSSTGAQTNYHTDYRDLGPVFSPDGTKVMFSNSANNLISGDDFYSADIFIKDLTTGVVTLVSANGSGTKLNSDSFDASFSSDGTKVIFSSIASNTLSGVTNTQQHVYLKDLSTGAITLVSSSAAGVAGNSLSTDAVLSSDGTKAVFCSYASNLVSGDANNTNIFDIFVKDLTTGAVTLVTTDAAGVQADANSYNPIFSPDGTKVLFESNATNLVAGDTNNASDLFVKDLITGSVTRVSSNALGEGANAGSFIASFSPDGTKVLFHSSASNLVDGDTNTKTDIFLKDLVTGSVTLLNIGLNGALGNNVSDRAVFSPDGNTIAFFTYASNITASDTSGNQDIYVMPLYTYSVSGERTEDGSGTVVGKFGFTDAETADIHTVSVATPPVGTLGTLTATLVRDTAPGIGGEVTWSYSVDNSLVQYLKVGETKVETFTVQVNDGTTTTDQLVSITITGADDPLIGSATAVLETGQANAAYVVTAANLLMGFSDPDLETLSVTNLTANHGVVVDNGDGTFTITPDTDFLGTMALSYTVSNEQGESLAGSQSYLIEKINPYVGTTGNDSFIDVEDLGRDTYNGRAGVDTVSYQDATAGVTANLYDSTQNTGAASGDTYTSIENLTGSAFNDTLRGNSSNNWFDGGLGIDGMFGGVGDDSYVIDTIGDRASEGANQGFDTIYSSISYTLTANVEALVLTGAGDLTAYGNNLNNHLEGNAGKNILRGYAGSDTLYGGAGDDIYWIEDLSDVINEDIGANGDDGGNDRVNSSVSHTLGAYLESLYLQGTGHISATGNSLNNTIAGNSGNNRINGGLGNDNLYGGAGNDSYVFGLDFGRDTITETSGSDSIVFAAGISWSMIIFQDVGADRYYAINDGLNVASQCANRIKVIGGAGGAGIENIVFAPPSSLALSQSIVSFAEVPASSAVISGAKEANLKMTLATPSQSNPYAAF